MVADLQGAFINLAKAVEEDPPTDLESTDVSKVMFLIKLIVRISGFKTLN